MFRYEETTTTYKMTDEDVKQLNDKRLGVWRSKLHSNFLVYDRKDNPVIFVFNEDTGNSASFQRDHLPQKSTSECAQVFQEYVTEVVYFKEPWRAAKVGEIWRLHHRESHSGSRKMELSIKTSNGWKTLSSVAHGGGFGSVWIDDILGGDKVKLQ